jgi:hypothetical protein
MSLEWIFEEREINYSAAGDTVLTNTPTRKDLATALGGEAPGTHLRGG